MSDSSNKNMGVPFGVRQDAILEFMNDLKNLRGVELKDTVLLIIGAHAAEAKLGRFRATDDIDFLMYFRGPIYSLFNALTIEFPDKYDLVESEVEGTNLLYYAPKDSEVRVQIDVLSFRAFVDETDERRRFPVLERCQKLSKRLAGKDDVGKYIADIIDLFMFKISALNNPERKAEKLMHDIQDTQRFLAEIQGLAEFPSGYAKWIREELEKPDNECTSQFNDMASVLWQLIDGKEDEEEEEDQEEEEELF